MFGEKLNTDPQKKFLILNTKFMKYSIEIQNLKCGGCANSIKKGLSKIDSVASVEVNVEDSLVEIEANEAVENALKEELARLGYPALGESNPLGSKAKSFVSCAVGRMSS